MSAAEGTASYTVRLDAGRHEAENAINWYLKIGHLPAAAYTGSLRQFQS
jgi:hypothetical protein